MYLPEGRRIHLTNPNAHVVTSGDVSYLMMKAVLDAEKKIDNVIMREGIWSTIQNYLPESIDDCQYDQLMIVLGCMINTKFEYERRRHWFRQDKLVIQVIEVLDQIIEDFVNQFVGIRHEKKMQQNGDIFAADYE